MIDGLLRGTPGGIPGDLVLLLNVSALSTLGPPGGRCGAPAVGVLPGGAFFVYVFIPCFWGLGLFRLCFIVFHTRFTPSVCSES